ncbi:MAG: hypothetical protein ACJ744_15285 [Gaiellaceae bacterium]
MTTPSTGDATVAPAAAAMSIPRCCPGSSGCARSNKKGRNTGPSVGHAHASAAPGTASATNTATARYRINHLLLSVK